MIIEQELLEKWRVLRSPDDCKKMAEELPGTIQQDFQRVFRIGKCNDEFFKVMADFYEKKAAMVSRYLNHTDGFKTASIVKRAANL